MSDTLLIQPHSTIMVKVGSGILFSDEGPKYEAFKSLVSQARKLWKCQRIYTLFVVSGAMAAARHFEGCLGRNPGRFTKPALAGVGAYHLLRLWHEAAAGYAYPVCQVLVTYDGLLDPVKSAKILETVQSGLHGGALVIMNENDPVSDAEILLEEKGSGNDILTSKIARVVRPQGVLFLSEIGGVYDRDPREHSDAILLPHIRSNDQLFIESLNAVPSELGTEGMIIKLRSAISCLEYGPSAIGGMTDSVLWDYVRGKPTVGTYIMH